MSKLLFYILDYAAILPAAVMCMLPVLKSGRLRTRVLLPLVTAAAAVSSVILGLIRDGLDLDADIPLLIFLIPAAVFYFLAFDIKKNKLWFIFISTIAIFSFGGLSTHFVEAFVDPQIEMLVELAAKWGISLLFLTAEMIFIWRLRWLIENDNINAVWRFIWAVPAIVTAANYYMIPQDTANVRVGRVFQMYIMVELLLVVFYVIVLMMLYRIAKAITDKAESEQNAQLLGLQVAQSENLKKYLDSSARLRHDFVYMAKTAQALADNGETEKLKQLLDEYGERIDANSAPVYYCENTALNAITAYYVSDAQSKGITLTTKLNVAKSIIISDYELCSIVGNILDNAVAAAERVDRPGSEILFVADTKLNGDLYIAVSNPYNGVVREKNGKFSSTKADGHGIGLESVRAIVRKNNGYCNFRYDAKTFYSEIMLRQV